MEKPLSCTASAATAPATGKTRCRFGRSIKRRRRPSYPRRPGPFPLARFVPTATIPLYPADHPLSPPPPMFIAWSPGRPAHFRQTCSEFVRGTDNVNLYRILSLPDRIDLAFKRLQSRGKNKHRTVENHRFAACHLFSFFEPFFFDTLLLLRSFTYSSLVSWHRIRFL